MASATPRAPMVITHEGGLKFAAQVRQHRILVDQPQRSGGEDAGPSPIEMLGVSLGTCVAFYVEEFCRSRALKYEGMRVEVVQHGATNPSRVAEFVVKVILPMELPEAYATMLERVARSCPAHNTLAHGATVTVQIETAIPATT